MKARDRGSAARLPSTTAPRVLHLVTTAPTTRLMLGQLSAVRKAGFEVTLASAPGQELDMVAKQEGVGKLAIRMQREMAPWEDLQSLWHLLRAMRRLRPAVVNTGTAKAGLLGGLAAWLTGVPCRVHTLHGIRLETTRGLKRCLLICTERISCRCAHRVVCVSDSVRRRAVELGLASPDKTVLLGAGSFNGVDTARFSPTPARIETAARVRRQLGIALHAPVIGFVGRLTHDKGLSELVESYVLLRWRAPAARLLLIGRFETGDPVSEHTRRFIENDPGVVHIGYVMDPSIYYHVMDVLALPTYREGFPTVALEASAAGKPVVTTQATGAIDAVVEGVTGFTVPVGDAAALADALGRVLGDPRLAARLGREAQARVQRQFQQERVWAELVDLYRGLLTEHMGTLPTSPTGERRSRGRWISRAVKRAVDICGACLGLALGAPAVALAACAIRLCDGPPVLFRQARTGKDGRLFTICKLRTMRDVRDESGRMLADTQRLTRVGRRLRRLSLDELPQLWNVLKGEMSLVGPRPLLPEYLPAYTERERLRHTVKPGITGCAQINGRHTSPFSRRLELDSWYAEHWSLWVDLKILLLTIPRALWSRHRMVCQDEKVDDRGFWRRLQDTRAAPEETLRGAGDGASTST